MLPPRLEDKVLGQLRLGWIASLTQQIRDGTYVPTVSEVIYVPKTRFTTRPGSLLTLADRVVFEALSDATASKIERVIPDEEIVYWPRGRTTTKRWPEFEKAVLGRRGGPPVSHIVLADVAGFYESISHSRLHEALLQATGWPDLSAATASFLDSLMKSDRGLPQGLDASDRLASLYLRLVDAEILGFGFTYVRHGDDMRLAVASYEDAIRAAHTVERSLRKQGLLANSSKVDVHTIDRYIDMTADPERNVAAIQAKWRDEYAESVTQDDDATNLLELIDSLGLTELGWDWYHGEVSPDVVAEELKPHLTLERESAAIRLIRDALDKRPGGSSERSDQLSNEDFHQRVVLGLRILMTAHRPECVDDCEVFLTYYPEKTHFVCEYLAAVAPVAATNVRDVVMNIFERRTYLLGWERAWLLRTLAATGPVLDPYQSAVIDSMARSDEFDWLTRIEAAKILARTGELTPDLYSRIRANAPEVYRVDLVECAFFMRHEPWARQTMSAAQGDPVEAAVRMNLHGAEDSARGIPGSP
jgi:hypothetical protein